MIYTPNTIRIWQTINLMLGVFAVGLCIAVFGTALVDLAEIYESQVDNVVYLLSTRSVGSITSCLIADGVFRRWNIQIIVSVSTFLGGVCLAVVPVCPTLFICHIASFFIGFSIGLIEVGCNVWLITIWKEKSPAVLQFYHFMFGVGAMVAPFGAEPFLGKKLQPPFIETLSNVISNSTVNQFVNSTHFNVNTTETEFRLTDSRIHIPFAVYGIFYASTALAMVFAFLADPSDIRKEEESTSTHNKVSSCIGVTIISCMCVYVFLGVACEQGFSSMIAVYVIQNLNFSKSSGAFVVSVFWAAFTLSRIVATGMSIKMKPTMMLSASHIIMMCAAVALAVLPRSEWVLWSMTALYAFGLSPFFGNVCAWALQYMFLSHSHMAAIIMSVCMGAMLPPMVIGPFIESNPIVFMYSNISFSTLMAVTTICLLIFGEFIQRNTKVMSDHSLKRYSPVNIQDP